MAKMFAICEMVGGAPNIDPNATPYKGFVLCDRIGNYGAYLFSGTGAQLTAINALPQVYGLVAVTDNGTVKWGELDNTITPAVRTRINTWLTNHGYPTIPAGWTYRRVLEAVYKRVNDKFDLSNFDIAD